MSNGSFRKWRLRARKKKSKRRFRDKRKHFNQQSGREGVRFGRDGEKRVCRVCAVNMPS